MVFFGTNYEAHINHEFGVHSYFNYEMLKNLTHKQEELHKIPYSEHKKKFAYMFEREVSRVDDEFASNLSKNDYLMVDCKHLGNGLKGYIGPKSAKQTLEASLKRNLTVLYRKLSELETYRLLNRTLIIKILKKYDKVNKKQADPVFESLMATVDHYRLGNGRKLKEFHADVEVLYADFFCDGLREEAQGKLTLSKGEHRPKKMFFLALKVGIFFTLVAWFFFDVAVSPELSSNYFLADDPSVYVYAFVASLIVYRWIWGFNVYMWESVGIDYILLLDLDAKKSNIKPSYDQIFSEATNYSILFFINIIVFHAVKMANFSLKESEYSFYARNAYVFPTSLLLGVLGTALNNYRHISYGVFSLNVFMHCFTAPFTAVTFRHTYAADIFTSFAKVIGFAARTGCYFTTGTFLYAANKEHDYGSDKFEACDTSDMHAVLTAIYVIPHYIRFMQNMRQQFDSIQRRREAEAAACRVIPIESTVISDAYREDEIEDYECDDDVEEMEAQKSDSLTVTEVNQDEAGGDELGGEAAIETGGGGRKTVGGKGKGKGRTRMDSGDSSDNPNGISGLSHSESQSDLHAIHPTKTPKKPGSYSTRVKKFVASYLLIWPYSYNAFKYFLSMLVILIGAYPPADPESVPFQVCYLSLACTSTIYSTYWDYRNDWGLFQMKSPKPLLRDKIYYGNTEYLYYIIIFLNPIFRSFWTLSFTPYGHHPFLACFEIFRRSLWACLRMELGYINELKKRSHTH